MAWNLNEAITYYGKQGAPREQSALVALLREIQKEYNGSIPIYVLKDIADGYAVKESLLLAIIKRIPSLRLGNMHTLEMCAGPNCGKHAKLAECAEKLQKEAGTFTLRFVPCMRMCGKGPNIKWNGMLYHQADKELIRRLIKETK